MDNANNETNTVAVDAVSVPETTYTIAGTSFYKGETTLRFASSTPKARTAVLERGGHTAVVFLELPRPMVLKDAAAWLTAQGVKGVMPYGQRKTTNPKKVREEVAPGVVADAVQEVVPEPEVVVEPTAEEVAAAKAAAKRERDNERKRAARAAAKLAKEG